MKQLKWISVKERKPKCSKNKDALGTPVLIWPRDPMDYPGIDGQVYYGRRATGNRPTFYKYGLAIVGVTHWMYMPDGPEGEKE